MIAFVATFLRRERARWAGDGLDERAGELVETVVILCSGALKASRICGMRSLAVAVLGRGGIALIEELLANDPLV